MKKHLTFLEAKQVQIIEYLGTLGIDPAKIRGNDYWYHSPLRDERTPSFKVNAKLNLWYDHGSGEGGTIIDLGAKMNQCSLQEFLNLLNAVDYSRTSVKPGIANEALENKLEIRDVREISDGGLEQYLKTRGIAIEVARQYCKEADFSIKGQAYLAIAFPNGSGGYELRNHWFKGSSSPKDISLLRPTTRSKLCVLEGFIDFLSLCSIDVNGLKSMISESNFLILNSISFLRKHLPTIQSFSEINLFVDNDTAGTEAKHLLSQANVKFKDASIYYSDHKDVNDFAVAAAKENVSRKFRI